MPPSKEFEFPPELVSPAKDLGDNWYPPALEIILQNKQFFIHKDGKLSWEKKKKTFEKLQQVEYLLEITKHLSDKDFKSYFTKLKRILRHVPLLNTLRDRNLPVSEAHTGTTPFQHTFNALDKANSSELSPDMRKALRWIILAHDWGKMFGAVGYDSRFHGHQSVLLFYEFLSAHIVLPEQLKRKMIDVIENHHLFEVRVRMVAKMNGYGEPNERKITFNTLQSLMSKLADDEFAELILRFSEADVRSVRKYEHFSGSLLQITSNYNGTAARIRS